MNSWRHPTPSSWPIDEAETRLLIGVQRRLPWRWTVAVARFLSLLAEHSATWVALGVLACIFDASHRAAWIAVVISTLLAHAAATGIKFAVRRPRPQHEELDALGATLSRLSFPSSHAAGTTAFAVGAALIFPALWVASGIIILAMCGARLRLGVHYPTDVLAGALLGAASAALGAWIVP